MNFGKKDKKATNDKPSALEIQPDIEAGKTLLPNNKTAALNIETKGTSPSNTNN